MSRARTLADLGAGLTAPIAAGVFGPVTDVASASTCDIGAAATSDVRITGTTTITSLGTGTNKLRVVVFAAALTLTHNATSLILPNGGSNIVTAAGDTAIFISDGSGNWRCVAFQRAAASGAGDLLAANNLSDLASKKTGFDNINVHGADVASASTIDLDAATGVLVDVTGTTTITAVTLSDGRERVVRFTGALTFTNGASLVLPGGQSIVTAAGDYAILRGYAAGVVRCVSYIRKDGHALTVGLATIASGSTTDLGSKTEQAITISGTTTITSFGSSTPTGAIKTIYFSGALTLTHNGTSLILPGAANIVTVAGDCAKARHEGSGNWRVVSYLRAAGRPLNSGQTDTLAKGFNATSYSIGTVTGSGQTTTPDPANGNFQHATLNGSSLTGTYTFDVPASTCSIVVEIVNGGSGAVGATLSTSNYTKVTGDAYATTNGNKYLFFVTRSQTYKHLHIQALQ